VLGGFLSLLAAITFALNNASARRGVITGTLEQAMAISVPIGVPMFFLAAWAAGFLAAVFAFSGEALLALSAAGIVHFVIGRYCNYRANRAIGANLVGPLQQTSLMLTLVLAVLILGETLTPLRMLGIALVALGPMVTMWDDGEKPAPRAIEPAETADPTADGGAPARPAPFKMNYPEGVLFALLSAVGYGTSPILVRFGLTSKDLGASLAGGLISYVAATLVIAPWLLWPSRIRRVLAVEAEPAKWFTLSAVTVCISQMFTYMAYAVAPVSVVSPIQRLSIVFRLYFGHWLNPHHEVFGSKVYLGTAVSLVGALALSVSTDVVLAWLPLPDWAVALAHWQWP